MDQKNKPERVSKFFSKEDIEFLRVINDKTKDLGNLLSNSPNFGDDDYNRKHGNIKKKS